MEDTDLLKAAGLSTTGVVIVLAVYRVLKSIKGKRFVSSCCGKKFDVGIDVEQMTPQHIVIQNPIPLTRQETLGLPDPCSTE